MTVEDLIKELEMFDRQDRITCEVIMVHQFKNMIRTTEIIGVIPKKNSGIREISLKLRAVYE